MRAIKEKVNELWKLSQTDQMKSGQEAIKSYQEKSKASLFQKIKVGEDRLAKKMKTGQDGLSTSMNCFMKRNLAKKK